MPPNTPAKISVAHHAFLTIIIPPNNYDSTVSGIVSKDYRVMVTVALPGFEIFSKLAVEFSSSCRRWV